MVGEAEFQSFTSETEMEAEAMALSPLFAVAGAEVAVPQLLPVLSYSVKVAVKSPELASSLYTSTDVCRTADCAVMRRGLPPFQATRSPSECVMFE